MPGKVYGVNNKVCAGQGFGDYWVWWTAPKGSEPINQSLFATSITDGEVFKCLSPCKPTNKQ